MRPRLVGICIALAAHAAAADPKPLPRGAGVVPAFQPCFSTSECDARSICADSSGNGRYECRPVCAADRDCASAPVAARRCLAVTSALGDTFTERACARAPSTLATIVPLSASIATGLVSRYEAFARVSDQLRADVALRVPELREQLKAQLTAQINAAIAAQLAQLPMNLGTVRTTVDSVHFRPGTRPALVTTELAGAIFAGDSQVATWHAGLEIEAAAAPASSLPEQELLFTAHLVTSTIDVSVSPISATLRDVVRIPPQPARYSLRDLADKVPRPLQAKTIHAIRFLSADDREIVVEVDVQ